MDERKSFLLRIDSELWKELEKWAADDLRSVNGQVEWLLREAIRRRKKFGETAESPTAMGSKKRVREL
jgi:hypothetical protein